MIRFNKKFEFNQTFGKRTINKKTLEKIEIFNNYVSEYSNKIIFNSLNFKDINLQSGICYYLDPPYINTLAGYNQYWSKQLESELYDFIHKIDSLGSTFILSGVLVHNGNTSKLITDLITEKFNIKYLNCDYNKVSRIGDKETIEIIIKNF